MSKRHRELAEVDFRNSGSSSAWCSAHKGSAAAGRMFEDPEFLKSTSAMDPWILEQQSCGPVWVNFAHFYKRKQFSRYSKYLN
ncbi:MAG: hypothetical protein IPK68_23430 [Bdellovibrionales bacterium]|nr:hypothetical protein [Bdellovibrionales bacterium]